MAKEIVVLDRCDGCDRRRGDDEVEWHSDVQVGEVLCDFDDECYESFVGQLQSKGRSVKRKRRKSSVPRQPLQLMPMEKRKRTHRKERMPDAVCDFPGCHWPPDGIPRSAGAVGTHKYRKHVLGGQLPTGFGAPSRQLAKGE